jgi:hypothetical protein
MKLQLIFTLDYEIFGDGTGNVNREQIIPTNQLLDIFEQYNAKLTLFFEYGQYLGYEKFASEHNSFEADNQLIVKQLKDVIERGHDVQFHYHPTWNKAKYENGEISLDSNLFDISDLDEPEIEEILTSGKSFLEDLLKSINLEYECNSFRAGAWSMKKPSKVLPILKKCGFKCDSSVAPNAKFSSTYGKFDYTNSPKDFGSWYIDIRSDLLTKVSLNHDFLELPIYTKKSRLAFTKYFNQHYLKSQKIVSKFYKTKVSEQGMSKIDKIKKIIARNYYMADFNTMMPRTLLDMMNGIYQEYKDTDKSIPLVLIGHSKSSYFNDELHLFFQQLEKYDGIEYKNMRDVVEKLI